MVNIFGLKVYNEVKDGFYFSFYLLIFDMSSALKVSIYCRKKKPSKKPYCKKPLGFASAFLWLLQTFPTAWVRTHQLWSWSSINALQVH